VLAIAAAKECGTPRGPSWSPLSTGSIRHADLPGASSTLDAGAGPLSIPNAALEPVGWGDLDGWTSDDHAVAFATFNASCRAIVRAVAFRAESETDHAADPRPIRAALEQVCIRAMRAGELGSETARQIFETNFVPVRIRKLGDPAGFVTGYYDPIVDGSRFSTREFTGTAGGSGPHRVRSRSQIPSLSAASRMSIPKSRSPACRQGKAAPRSVDEPQTDSGDAWTEDGCPHTPQFEGDGNARL
jgi:membrane-bound lytic murein transglycosylase A